jgi:hypothetical protein
MARKTGYQMLSSSRQKATFFATKAKLMRESSLKRMCA